MVLDGIDSFLTLEQILSLFGLCYRDSIEILRLPPTRADAYAECTVSIISVSILGRMGGFKEKRAFHGCALVHKICTVPIHSGRLL